MSNPSEMKEPEGIRGQLNPLKLEVGEYQAPGVEFGLFGDRVERVDGTGVTRPSPSSRCSSSYGAGGGADESRESPCLPPACCRTIRPGTTISQIDTAIPGVGLFVPQNEYISPPDPITVKMRGRSLRYAVVRCRMS